MRLRKVSRLREERDQALFSELVSARVARFGNAVREEDETIGGADMDERRDVLGLREEAEQCSTFRQSFGRAVPPVVPTK